MKIKDRFFSYSNFSQGKDKLFCIQFYKYIIFLKKGIPCFSELQENIKYSKLFFGWRVNFCYKKDLLIEEPFKINDRVMIYSCRSFQHNRKIGVITHILPGPYPYVVTFYDNVFPNVPDARCFLKEELNHFDIKTENYYGY